MSGQTVLVIDDSPTILKVVQLVLTKAGFTVFTAADGYEGVEVAKKKKPDLILLDFVMPKMNGYQVCRALHEEEALSDVPADLESLVALEPDLITLDTNLRGGSSIELIRSLRELLPDTRILVIATHDEVDPSDPTVPWRRGGRFAGLRGVGCRRAGRRS